MKLSKLKLGVILPPSSSYNVINEMAFQLAEALKADPDFDVLTFEILTSEGSAFFDRLKDANLDLILSYNSYYADDQNRLFCDRVQIPSIFCLVDAPYNFSDVKSPYASIGYVDRRNRAYLDFFQFERTFFFPHAIDTSRYVEIERERPYDCVMIATGFRYRHFLENIKRLASPDLWKVVMETIDAVESDGSKDIFSTFKKRIEEHPDGWNLIDSDRIPAYKLLKSMEQHIKGHGRIRMLQALKNVRIDLFGGGDSWTKLLGNSCPHVTIHPEVSFDKAKEIMASSKIVLNHCDQLIDSAHERIFAALACGAIVTSNQTGFLQETFSKENGILFYHSPDFASLEEQIQNCLLYPEARRLAVEKGQSIIHDHHLWKNRIILLKEFINSGSCKI